ncbi:MAG: beta-lactamase family protein [Gemmatimonadetes bacterium]|nr:beta-lactamase family protein [Gemmatimonadota bacterium]
MPHCRRARSAAVAASLALTIATSGARAQAPSIAQHPRVQEALAAYEKWLDAQRAWKRIPGASAALVVDQDVLWQGGSGYMDVERRIPATASTAYSICSISKLFTSIATLQLRDAGKLRLDDPVSKHLPWFTPRSRYADEGAITVEGLLTHASGLQRELADTLWLEPGMMFPTFDEVMRGVKDREVAYRPERYFQYSNLGFTLLGAVVSAASGEPWSTYVTTHINAPLGLTSTSVEYPTAERGKTLAIGYSASERDGSRHPMPPYQTKAMAAAAGYASTPLDLAKFAAWQFRVLAGTGGSPILSKSTLREMQRVHFTDPSWETTWGLGFEVWRKGDKTFVGHGGSCPGYRTQLTLQPEDKIASIVMTNAGDADAMALAQQGHEFLGPALKEALADSSRSLKAADPSLDPYVGTYWSFGGEMEVIRWKGALATMYVPSDEPVKSITRWKKVGEDTFQEIRKDGEDGEIMRFDRGRDGKVFRARTNYMMRRIK